MKKTLALVLAAVMLVTVCAAFSVSADAESFVANAWNPAASELSGQEGAIYTTVNTNNGWWHTAAFAPNGDNWEVVATSTPDGTILDIPEGGFVWALHDTGSLNWAFIDSLQVGDVYVITGLDLANQTCAADATIALYDGSSEPSEDPSDEPAEPTAEWKDLWLTHYNEAFVEGSGVVFTEAYSGAGWWDHIPFAPVEGSKAAYEIIAISNGTPDGSGVAQAIPEGGFVYCLNYGNDYPSLGMGGDDLATDGARNMLEDALNNWAIGDKFVFEGLDLANKTVPTSTPDVEWYKDGEYVCTGKYKVYEPAIDDVVTDDESTDSEESTTPEAGDASSMIVFAIIALVAIAGSAVVIKSRN
jgi:hypothetical protein